MGAPGQIVVLNGAPRSGKTSICRALQECGPGLWVNLGVDASERWVPPHVRPGVGLRPGGERPDLEDTVVALYAALYESVAAHARLGFDVVVDVGHHEWHSKPLHIRRRCAARLEGLPVLFVGVRCPLDVVWQRRERSWEQPVGTAEPELRAAVERWQRAVHAHDGYDLEVDTSVLTPAECAGRITARLADGPPGTAFGRWSSS